MLKFFLCLIILSRFTYCASAQSLSLSAQYDEFKSILIFSWQMVNHQQKTTYILERSTDKKTWTVSVTDNHFQKYSGEDIFDFEEKVFKDKIYFYRLSIINENEKIIARAPVVTVNTSASVQGWKLLQNPVSDQLLLINKGSSPGGIIHVLVVDASGKTVIKYRAASIHNSVSIPVTKLKKGWYVVQLMVANKTLLNQKFMKQ